MGGQPPAAVFVSSDDGRHWLDSIATGTKPPIAVGVPRTREAANGEILDIADIAPHTLVLLSGCVPCTLPGHPDGSLGSEISSDGGRRWSALANPDTSPLPYLSASEGVGTLIALTSPTHEAILAQSATNPQHLTLIQTNDQGRIWQRIATFPP
jgi:hypothetical protein